MSIKDILTNLINAGAAIGMIANGSGHIDAKSIDQEALHALNGDKNVNTLTIPGKGYSVAEALASLEKQQQRGEPIAPKEADFTGTPHGDAGQLAKYIDRLDFGTSKITPSIKKTPEAPNQGGEQVSSGQAYEIPMFSDEQIGTQMEIATNQMKKLSEEQGLTDKKWYEVKAGKLAIDDKTNSGVVYCEAILKGSLVAGQDANGKDISIPINKGDRWFFVKDGDTEKMTLFLRNAGTDYAFVKITQPLADSLNAQTGLNFKVGGVAVTAADSNWKTMIVYDDTASPQLIVLASSGQETPAANMLKLADYVVPTDVQPAPADTLASVELNPDNFQPMTVNLKEKKTSGAFDVNGKALGSVELSGPVQIFAKIDRNGPLYLVLDKATHKFVFVAPNALGVGPDGKTVGTAFAEAIDPDSAIEADLKTIPDEVVKAYPIPPSAATGYRRARFDSTLGKLVFWDLGLSDYMVDDPRNIEAGKMVTSDQMTIKGPNGIDVTISLDENPDNKGDFNNFKFTDLFKGADGTKWMQKNFPEFFDPKYTGGRQLEIDMQRVIETPVNPDFPGYKFIKPFTTYAQGLGEGYGGSVYLNKKDGSSPIIVKVRFFVANNLKNPVKSYLSGNFGFGMAYAKRGLALALKDGKYGAIEINNLSTTLQADTSILKDWFGNDTSRAIITATKK